MGNKESTPVEKAPFESVLALGRTGVLISVFDEDDQNLLIVGTVSCAKEVEAVERAIAAKTSILVYGRNWHDERVYAKYAQIKKLGGLVKVYLGGLFEWILLNEIYGNDRFPLTAKVVDLYQYRPK